MLEELFQMVKEYGKEQVVDNPEIPNDKNEAVMAEASHAVAGTLQSELAKGNFSQVKDMFRSDSSAEVMSNPLAQNMQSGFLENIVHKLGINKNVASGLAATLIPMVVSKLVKRTNSSDAADSSFSLENLVSGLTGGGGGSAIGGLLNQFSGGGSSAGGSGLDNLFSNARERAAEHQNKGGLDSLIGNFFGR